ncbi:MAG: UvrD-helicase domain-containing protein [Ruminococcus sp.]|nr:UvrD-helicase domain-containing protein [Ruminococcus sp.]
MDDFINAKRSALNKYFERMNDMQKEAVFAVNGPVLILAGAGSGKTTVLVNRIANMVLFGNAYNDESGYSLSEEDMDFLKKYDGGRSDNTVSRLRDIISHDPVNPWNILAITFTNKAADELKNRLAAMLGDEDGRRIHASTFHSACVRILRREINRLGYSSGFTIYDSDDSLRLIKTCMDVCDISEKAFSPKMILSEISSAKDKLITPEMYAENAGADYRLGKIAKIYREYRTRLRVSDALDFDDIIMLTVQLFEQHPDVLEHYQNLYKYIMVDEYQDTNTAQYKLVSLLAEKNKNLCVVGDDDQSIYRFRGATIENILSFEDQFADCTVIRLEQNYRSMRYILDAANTVIANNNGRKEKRLWTDKGDGEKITVYKSSDEQGESNFVARTIAEEVKKGKKYSDFAVLYRMNAQSNSVEKAFTSCGIPYRVIGGMRFYDRKEIKDIIAYLSVINNPNDMLRFKRIVNEPKRGIGESTLSMIEQISLDLKVPPVEVMKNSDTYAPLSKKSASLMKTADMFESIAKASETLPIDELFDMILEKSGYAAMLKTQGDEGAVRLENIEELKSNILTYMQEREGTEEEPTLSGFLEEISLYTDTDKLTADADAVCMMTMHSAKGLEFPTVFIVGMEDGIFPSLRSAGDPDDLEEERRLAYVGITRAREKLYITYAKQRMLFGTTQRNIQSRFIKEIDKECIDKIDGTAEAVTMQTDDGIILPVHNYNLQSHLASKKMETFKKSQSMDFKVGDRVKHNKFGEGTVTMTKEMGNDHLLEISFDGGIGTKKIMAKYAKIVKL